MGLDIGLEKAGLHIAIGQDLEMTCVETMRANGWESAKICPHNHGFPLIQTAP